MRRIFLMVFVITATFAAPLHAIKPGGSKVVLPIIGRFAGAFGTEWRTDVFIRNVYSNVTPITLTFYVVNGPTLQSTITLQSYRTVTMPDIVKSTFGLDSGSGQLIVQTADSGYYVEARARIYNVGNAAGEFGQGMMGLSTAVLQRQSLLFGLNGTNGNRVNVGVANPNDVAVGVTILVQDATVSGLHTEVISLQPHETRQFNNIFALFGIPPQDTVSVEFMAASSETPIYGYASEVRNDTGDAVFTFGTGPNV